jgi:tetratricopeptide (TPR) repeat protein
VDQYQRAFDYIKEWGLKYHQEAALYGNMGEVHFAQKNFSQALENFKKVLALGQSPNASDQVGEYRIGDIMNRKPVEAILPIRRQSESDLRSCWSEESAVLFRGATAIRQHYGALLLKKSGRGVQPQ